MENTKWNRLSETQPEQNERVLVSDGQVIVIARKVTDHWMFDSGCGKDMVISYWIELPKLPEIIEKIDLTQAD